MIAKDMLGYEFKIGDIIVYATLHGKRVTNEFRIVHEIGEDNKGNPYIKTCNRYNTPRKTDGRIKRLYRCVIVTDKITDEKI